MTLPLTPAEADLQDFPFMPLHVARLRDSDLAGEEKPEACWYAVLLWAASWHQLPAGSLPDNEAVLTKLIGLGRDVRTFRRHREAAMRGFVKCDDGRLYHPVVAEQVVAAWESKLQQRWRSELARIKKANQRNGTTLPSPTYEEFLAGVSPAQAAPSPQPVPGDAADCPSGQSLQETGTGTGILEEESFALSSTAPKVPSGRGPTPADVQRAFELWNEAAGRLGLAVAVSLSQDRRTRIRSKLADHGIDGWKLALGRIEASDFCRGGGPRKWRIDLDALCQNLTWNRLMEGSYDSPEAAPGQAAWPVEKWAGIVALWHGGEPWPEHLGPAPDQPGTRVPAAAITSVERKAA